MHEVTQPAAERFVYLGGGATTRRDRGLAWGMTAMLLVGFGLSIPYASRPLPALPAFAPIYDTAVIVLDVITAYLLHAQYRQLRQRSLLALACGYTFTPIVMLAHGLSFPDAFGPGSLFGGAQTTGWLWVAWHGVFPCFVGAYALLVPRAIGSVARPAPEREQRLALLATLGLAGVAILLAIWAQTHLPPLMVGSRYTDETATILAPAWMAHLAALVLLLARTRLRRRLDLWIAVTLVAWWLDLALSAVLVTGRYQFGFYFGRLYGLLASSFVLAVLLRETLDLFRAAVESALRLAGAEAALRSANDTLEARVAERAAALEAEVRARRALALRLATAHEDERKHFARELHDSIGQLIAGLTFTFKAIERSGELPPAARGALVEARCLADALGKEVHDLAVRLRPTALDDIGLEAALDQLVAEWSARSGITADYETVGLSGQRFATEVETCVYRVVQEALTNVAKHAHAKRVGVVVTRPAGDLSVVIEDDGRGFDEHAVPHGRLGLLGMHERAALVGGTLTIESSGSTGTMLTLRIPARAALPGHGEAPPASGLASLAGEGAAARPARKAQA